MIPLRDSNKSRTVPFITYALIVACGVVFLYELSLGPELEPFLRKYAVIPRRIGETLLAGHFSLNALLTLFTSLFLHGGWLHLIGNMLYLFVFGDNVEDRLGHAPFLLFYVLCGTGAAMAEVYFQQSSSAPMIGASGAIAGVLGAYFLLYPHAKVLTLIPLIFFFPVVEISAFFFLGFWFLMQFLQGWLAGVGQTGVAWWAHTGGFIAGAVLLPVFLLGTRARAWMS